MEHNEDISLIGTNKFTPFFLVTSVIAVSDSTGLTFTSIIGFPELFVC